MSLFFFFYHFVLIAEIDSAMDSFTTTNYMRVRALMTFDSIRVKLQTQRNGTRGPPHDDDLWYSTNNVLEMDVCGAE